MAALPNERTILTRPFAATGIDFAGPYDIKNYTGRACLITKGDICVFVCFSTKAIHLEPVSDLTTQAFLAAFSRFFSRRGCPANLYSDNGTNFIGASQLLMKDRRELLQTLRTQITSLHSHQNISWHFNPPGAPHMGGLWEAGVKSLKIHLKKIAKLQKFTFEEFATLLTRIESCLNSRPISPISDDSSNLEPLTPGHFLIGTPLLTPAEPNLEDANLSIVNRWQKLKILYQHICKRWKEEYLKELHKRYKWKYPQRNIEVNDLVVIRNENISPNEWKLGRIQKVFPGLDNKTRVVEIRTAQGTITRPITKIVILNTE
ncbi:uncharacterized protein LOC126766984 [Bactrocera neohumeralis]|uniref:uncharacterized protein LOC126766984 n=1 Tax=Bactrocera neohumeralis TaxID=98809 RepID=UPI002166AB2D|nr:uncharacterized protein LOC126766984 [Bactrocera neohumeralis]